MEAVELLRVHLRVRLVGAGKVAHPQHDADVVQPRPRLGRENAPLALFYVSAVLLLVPFFTRFVLTVFQAQGRYFLPALLPIALLATLAFASASSSALAASRAPRRFVTLPLPASAAR